jgi:Ca-activated chloride channel homolog
MFKERFFETFQQLCYHFGDSGVKQVLLSRRFGAATMKSAQRINALLIVSIILLLASSHSRHLADLFAPDSAQAQESSKSNKPPLRRPKPVKSSQEEQDEPAGQTSISVAVDLVTLQVLVTDKKNNIITGLKPENFTIYEDNVKQEIANFAPIEGDMTIVLLLECSKQIRDFLGYFDLLPDIADAINSFVRTLRKNDWVAVVGYDMRPTILSDFSRDRKKLGEALTTLSYPLSSESNLSDAVIDTLNRTQEIDGKVAIVLIGTGMDTFSKHTYDDALKKCKEANASIYAIGLGQYIRTLYESRLSPSGSMDFLVWENQLRSFAEFTGGASFFPRLPSQYSGIFNDIANQLRNQYSIGYVSSNTQKDGKFRKIRVEVKTDLMENGKPLKINVLTRKGYIAAKT